MHVWLKPCTRIGVTLEIGCLFHLYGSSNASGDNPGGLRRGDSGPNCPEPAANCDAIPGAPCRTLHWGSHLANPAACGSPGQYARRNAITDGFPPRTNSNSYSTAADARAYSGVPSPYSPPVYLGLGQAATGRGDCALPPYAGRRSPASQPGLTADEGRARVFRKLRVRQVGRGR